MNNQIIEENAANGYVRMENAGVKNEEENEESAIPNIHSVGSNVSVLSTTTALTVDEIADPLGFFIMCCVVWIGDMARGILFPTLWPLMKSLGGTEVYQGYAVAAFSFGRIIVSPIFGTWSINKGYTKTLLTSCSILLIGTLFYAQAPILGSPYFLILAQATMGVGSGTLGVTRAFVADVTPHRNRTKYLSWLTAVQFAGFTVTPILGSFITEWFKNEEDDYFQLGIFILSPYSAPAYFMTIMCAGVITLILVYFKDRPREPAIDAKRMKRTPSEVIELSNERTFFSLMNYYEAALLGCMALNVVTKGSIGSFETLGVVIANDSFGIENTQAGFIIGTCGLIGVFVLLSMGHIAIFLSDIQMIVFGTFVLLVGNFILIGVEKQDDNPTWRYIISIFMVYSLGYPIGHTAVIGLFSKIVGRRPQGTLQGMFASAGSLARIIFPITSGYISHYFGTTSLFILIISVLVLTIIFTLSFGKVLIKLSS